MAKVTMPQLGESVAEGTIGRWLKNVGDRVEKYEPIVEVITDKVNAEVPSPFAGTLTAILVEEGATVPNDTPIAEIETAEAAGEAASEAAPVAVAGAAPAARPAAPAPPPFAPTTAAPAAPPTTAAPTAPPTAAAATAAQPAVAVLPAVAQADARMTPAVRRLLREHGLAPEQIRGTGGGGRITREDVSAVVEAIRTGAAPGPRPRARPHPRPPRPLRQPSRQSAGPHPRPRPARTPASSSRPARTRSSSR